MVEFQELKNKGFKFHQEGNFDEAEKCYLEVLEINPNNAETYNLIGLLKLQQNNFDKAVEWIKKAIKLEKNAYFYETLFQTLTLQEKFSEIIRYEKDVKEFLDKGYSINKIANELGCDWSTVKARADDIFDNPELLEVGE